MDYIYKKGTVALTKTEDGNITISVAEPDNFRSLTIKDKETVQAFEENFTRKQYVEGYNQCIEEFVGMFKNLYGEEEWNKAVSKWKETL